MSSRAGGAPMALRWLLLVHLPLAAAVAGLLALLLERLPRWATLPLVIDIAWSLIALRLLAVRARVRGGGGAFRELALTAVMAVVALASGFLLLTAGVGRLSTGVGPALLYSGIFLLALAVAAPAFKVADWTFKGFAERVRAKRRPPRRAAPRLHSRGSARPAPQAGAGPARGSGVVADNEAVALFPPEVHPALGYGPSEAHQRQGR